MSAPKPTKAEVEQLVHALRGPEVDAMVQRPDTKRALLLGFLAGFALGRRQRKQRRRDDAQHKTGGVS